VRDLLVYISSGVMRPGMAVSILLRAWNTAASKSADPEFRPRRGEFSAHPFLASGQLPGLLFRNYEASTSFINARFVHGIAHLLFSLLCISELAIAAQYPRLPVCRGTEQRQLPFPQLLMISPEM